MAKKTTASTTTLKPDVKYSSKVVSKFINCIMYEGKKSVAESIFYDALEVLGKKIKEEKPEDVFLKAIDNLKPEIEVRSKRVGGQTYQVPMPVSPKRRQALAIKWLIEVTRGKKGRPMAQKLADEIIAAFKKEGDAMTKRENVHKMAEANKLFAHFAW